MAAHDHPPIPVCPTCLQPGTQALSNEQTWECRNEACPEFSQLLRPDEPLRTASPAPTPPRPE